MKGYAILGGAAVQEEFIPSTESSPTLRQTERLPKTQPVSKHPIASVLESDETVFITLPFAWKGNWLTDPALNLGDLNPSESVDSSTRYLGFEMKDQICELITRHLELLTVSLKRATQSQKRLNVRTWTVASDTAFRSRKSMGLQQLFNLAVAYSRLSEFVLREGILLARGDGDLFSRTVLIPSPHREKLSRTLSGLSNALEDAVSTFSK